MDLSAFVGKLLEEQDGDVLREGIRVLSQALMETEVAGLISADRHERTPDRTRFRTIAHGRVPVPPTSFSGACEVDVAPTSLPALACAICFRL